MTATKLRTFFALWHQFAKVAQRDDRLLWCSQQLGQDVESLNQLSDDDGDLLIAELRRELKPRASGNVIAMDGKPAKGTRASKEVIWKIHQVESYLGWRGTPERLDGFWRELFKADIEAKRLVVTHVNYLPSRYVWRLIEALIGVAAQSAFDGRKPKKDEKAAETLRIKGVLRTWRAA